MSTPKQDSTQAKPSAFERTLAALVAVPKAEIDALEAARPKKKKSVQPAEGPKKKSAG